MEAIISTDRLLLREWGNEDIEPFIALNRDKDVMEFFPSIYSPEQSTQMVGRIRDCYQQNGYCFYACELKQTAEFMGFIGFAKPGFESFFTPCVEIGWRLAKRFWGKGFATEGAAACLEYGFNHLGFIEIYSFTAVLNKKSERIMQKTGMVKAGEFEHPSLSDGHPLKTHVLYKKAPEKSRAL